MKTITQYREDIANLMKKAGDIDAKATAENRELDSAEIALQTEILDAVEKTEASVKVLERKEAVAARLNTPAKPKTVVDTQTIKIVDRKDKDRFSSFGQQMAAVMRAGSPGGTVDPRLYNAATGLNETTPSDGGFLVQDDFSSTILKNVWDSGVILPRVNKVTLSGNKNGMKFNGLDETSRVDGSRAGGIRAYWAAEAAEKTASKPKFRRIELSLNKLIGLCYATDELLEDTSALAQTIETGFQDEFDFKITDAIINGSGAGQPLGILNSGCMVSISGEAGQAADTIVYENVLKMWARLMARSRPNSIWIINQDCEPQLNAMSIAVGTGGVPVYLPAGGVSAQPYSTLFGRPVVPIEQCATVGDTGDIMLCDFSKYMAIDKGGMQSDMSIHVRFIYDEQVFRFVYRFDGEPQLGSAITPFKGSNTLSHFVKLDAR
jgi:HK97 family phage major capsid protein